LSQSWKSPGIFFCFLSTNPESDIQQCRLRWVDWSILSARCANELRYEDVCWARDPLESFVTRLIDSANQMVPKTSPHSWKISKPWFNDNCKAAVNERRAALTQLKANTTHDNLNNFRTLQVKAQRFIREAR
jgi:hypothetical protein